MKFTKNIFSHDLYLFKGCLVIVLICSLSTGYAETVTSVQNGNWNDPATWDCVCIPVAADNVVISSGDIITLTADITINNLTISSLATLDVSVSNYKIYNEGNLINDGIFLQRNGEVIFQGASAQTISGSKATHFYNLKMDNNAGVTLDASISVTHNLMLTNGILYTNNSYYVTIETEASTIGGSDNSFINGSIKIETDTIKSIVFDTGKNGKHKKIAVDVNSTDPTAFIAEYFENAFSNTTCGAGLDHLTTTQSWQLDRVSGTAGGFVTLHWDGDVNNGSGPIHNLSNARVARFNNTEWVDEGNTATTGNPASGSMRSNSIGSFGYFTFSCCHACGPGNSDFGHSQGNGRGKGNNKKGNSNELYDTSDDEVIPDNTYEYSKNNIVQADYSINVYPNPSRSDKLCVDIIGNNSREVLIVVVDLLGKEHYSKVCILEDGKHTLAIDLRHRLEPGVYLVIGSSNNSLYRKKIVIQ